MIQDLKAKFGNRCLTKTENRVALELYNYILTYETIDSDYWILGYGCDDVINILERVFDSNGWNSLINDIENWSLDQVELLSRSIITGEGSRRPDENDDVYNLIKNDTLINRAYLIIKILDLNRKCETSLYVWENLDFLIKISMLSKELTVKIVEKIGYYEYISLEGYNSEGLRVIEKLLQE
ncbi:hypothetical protein DMB65_11510 [Flavobacterium cheongpyeongense]|uniref:Uncharacterized protein n=1 Tax=Flavobacterium cheongpyeongense TaxID=2212651 RepID=A0A2V4C2U6_9FLAO|nr:hypothetical protein [Flavobacterium cheongpyeongense]PXY40534.1 hypothetical protein DMB65_11510 [Flavobacterium cheongpyeongense]